MVRPLRVWLVTVTLCSVLIALMALGFDAISHPPRDLATTTQARVLLPDLDQESPSELQVKRSGGTSNPVYWLGFRSAVRNVGAGPLRVQGARGGHDSPYMRVDQLLERSSGQPVTVPDVGRLQYAISPDHQHWHYLGFERYRLHSARLERVGAGTVAVAAAKAGFCLGDRYRVTTRVLPAAASHPRFVDQCGLHDPGRLKLSEGISVGYGDDYHAFLEGQEVRISGLPNGRYLLVNQVNEGHRLREISYANNASSVLLQLRWQAGVPHIRVLASCPDVSDCARHVDVHTVATGLEIPWDIAFMPDGSALVTERPGRVRLLDRHGRLRREPVADVAVAPRGEGGLLGLALDPAFETNKLVYLYFTAREGMKLERWRWMKETLVRQTTLVSRIRSGDVHDSGRIAFAPDGRLMVATGDAGEPESAQDPGSLNGKLLSLSAAQYRGPGPVEPEVIATGLRNPQGMAWQPGTNRLYATDHGPSGFDGPEGYDEVNRIEAGANYGWPRVIGYATDAGKYTAPVRVYRNPIAPSGAAFIDQPGSPWSGDLVIAALRGESLERLQLAHGTVVVDETLLKGRFGRLRTVRPGPHGCLYALTSNRDGRGTPRQGDDRILCIRIPPA
jgi:glucose/arabinose dehydrogenase